MPKCFTLQGHEVAFEPTFFASFFDLYTETIPTSEREDMATIRAQMDQDDYFFILLINQRKVVGYSISFISDTLNYALLGYMGVTTEMRSRGLGTRMMNILKLQYDDHDILIEVDSIHQDADDIEQRRKRVRFYQRNGARLIQDFSYIMPLNIPGFPPPDMDLMIVPQFTDKTLSRRRLKRILTSIYADAYQMPDKDHRLELMMQAPFEAGLTQNID